MGRLYNSVVDRHRFKCRSGYESYNYILMPIQIRILPQIIHKLKNEVFLFTFILCNASVLFYVSHQCHRDGINFNILDRIFEIIWKKYGIVYLYSWLKWIQIRFRIGRPYPGSAKLCRSYRIWIHNTALQAETDFFVITGCLFCRVCLLVAA